MIVVDVEASGVDPFKNSLLSIGAVEFEHPENQFYEECRIWEGAHIEDQALAVNGFTRDSIVDQHKKTDREIVEAFIAWVLESEERTLAGQNTSFDRDFLRATAMRYHINWPFAHRTLDLHSIAYFHAVERGIVPPQKNHHSDFSLDHILKYCGLPPEEKPHNGLNGARLEAEIFGRFFKNNPLFKEYSQYPLPWLKIKV